MRRYRKTTTDKQRFNKGYVINETTKCWLWRGQQSTKYPLVIYQGKPTRVHRVSHILHVGPIPKGLFVCHHCDIPRCVNPDHLFLGSALDNHKDMMSKNRGPVPLVEKHKAHLMRLEGYSFGTIGEHLGVSRQRIHQLLRPNPQTIHTVCLQAKYHCGICGIYISQGDIHSSDIKKELALDTPPKDLEYLCRPCHRKAHEK